MKHTYALLSCSLLLTAASLRAQCPTGEAEVTIVVNTDAYGYETYWEFTPFGDPCGTNTVFAGGNPNMDCGFGGAQDQQQGGYGNNAAITEGPWCLPIGAGYTIWSIDDWGDGHPTYQVYVDGVLSATFGGEEGTIFEYSFAVQGPAPRDLSITELFTNLYSETGETVPVKCVVKNLGSDEVTSFSLHYTIDGADEQVEVVTGISLATGDTLEYTHTMPWQPTAFGTYALRVWTSDVNSGNDDAPFNNERSVDLKVNVAKPVIIDDIMNSAYTVTQVGNTDQELLVPRDLDFHPDLERNELWVINKDTPQSGGTTVKFTAVGAGGMQWLWQEDPNNWHFMALPTGIAFSRNGNFSTCPGIFDANQTGGTDPFTGPSLWSSDPAVYAQNLFGPLGSHLDMLHVTPNSQGIAADQWNKFWVVDGFNGDIVMHDFRKDHGPGNSFHGNAIIRRYDEINITKDPNNHVVSHCALDKNTGWLYAADFGGQRIIRIDTRGGSVSGPGNYGPWETYAEYSMVTGYADEVVASTGLVQPAGIEVIGDRLLVSDHANGDIIVYDISTTPVVELGRIETNSPGIMGLTVGPDGRIWFVNATTHQLMVVGQGAVAVVEHNAASWRVSPTITDGRIQLTGGNALPANMPVDITDVDGRIVLSTQASALRNGIDVSGLATGTYLVRIADAVRRVVRQ